MYDIHTETRKEKKESGRKEKVAIEIAFAMDTHVSLSSSQISRESKEVQRDTYIVVGYLFFSSFSKADTMWGAIFYTQTSSYNNRLFWPNEQIKMTSRNYFIPFFCASSIDISSSFT